MESRDLLHQEVPRANCRRHCMTCSRGMESRDLLHQEVPRANCHPRRRWPRQPGGSTVQSLQLSSGWQHHVRGQPQSCLHQSGLLPRHGHDRHGPQDGGCCSGGEYCGVRSAYCSASELLWTLSCCRRPRRECHAQSVAQSRLVPRQSPQTVADALVPRARTLAPGRTK